MRPEGYLTMIIHYREFWVGGIISIINKNTQSVAWIIKTMHENFVAGVAQPGQRR